MNIREYGNEWFLCGCHGDRDAVTEPPSGTKIYKDSWDFKVYLDELNTALSSQIFKHKHWIEFYYKWAAFQNYNLVVRVDNKTHTALNTYRV